MRDRTYWLLGLPFDAVDLEGAVRRVRDAATSKRRLIVVTPNVNFVSLADRDEEFRRTILDSQLSVVDGMPLVWLGRKLGIPFPERVAGSSMLERLARDSIAVPIKVYFFGGEPGASDLAAQRIGNFGPGLVAVGSRDPGFGSIESMSTPEIIADINRSGAEVLILSLGAKKGHQWIAHNQATLQAPVITHLGAAVNFIAGTVSRAPAWMQGSGLEWLWRIRQEPKLFRRYWDDGLFFLRALRESGAAPAAAGDAGEAPFHAEPGRAGGANQWTLAGSLAGQHACSSLGAFLQQVLSGNQGGPTLDLSGVTGLDPESIGLLYAFRFRSGTKPRLICNSPEGLRLFRRHRAECLLSAPLVAAPVHC